MTASEYGTASLLRSGRELAGFEYGNTRLRAQRSRLLEGADYRELFATGSIERLLGALSVTPYGPDAERALVRHDALHWLDETIRGHLVRSFRAMSGFYEGDARVGVDLLLARWDLRNLQSIIRMKARPIAYEDREPLLVAAGTLGEAVLAELASQPSLRSVLELMVAWDLPTRQAARRVLQQWPQYEATGDLVILESALQLSWAEHTADVLEGWRQTALASTLRAEVDLINLLTALRIRQTGIDGPAGTDVREGTTFLAEATLTHTFLDQVGNAPAPAEVVAMFEGRSLPTGWLAALRTWSSEQDLSALGGRLERALAHQAISLFSRGDPLGVDIPVAFVWAKECEARNLRLVGRAITHHIGWDDVEPELFPW